jgi:DNA mismatch endonuclease (patch repair protein)
MQAVKTKDTGPEMAVRRLLHKRGFRYRLHPRDLPGRPDIVFRSIKKAIFVHGCFWHGHNCAKGLAPKSRLEYWGPKLDANRKRDKKEFTQLKALGWSVMAVWQCEIRDCEKLLPKLLAFVEARPQQESSKRKLGRGNSSATDRD